MALTQEDLQAIRMALKPDFDDLGVGLRDYIDKRVHETEERVIADISTVFNEGLEMVSDKFAGVDRRFDRVEHRLDTLRIVSNS